MAELKPITLNDIRAAYAAGKLRIETYRGQGKTDSVTPFPTVESFLESNKDLKAHLKAEAKEAKKLAAEEAAKEEEKQRKIAELEAE